MTLRLSTKGQLVIPAQMRKALNLKSGDQITMTLNDQSLILRRASRPAAKLKPGKFGRPVLKAAPSAPAMTTASVTKLLEELP